MTGRGSCLGQGRRAWHLGPSRWLPAPRLDVVWFGAHDGDATPSARRSLQGTAQASQLRLDLEAIRNEQGGGARTADVRSLTRRASERRRRRPWAPGHRLWIPLPQRHAAPLRGVAAENRPGRLVHEQIEGDGFVEPAIYASEGLSFKVGSGLGEPLSRPAGRSGNQGKPMAQLCICCTSQSPILLSVAGGGLPISNALVAILAQLPSLRCVLPTPKLGWDARRWWKLAETSKAG